MEEICDTPAEYWLAETPQALALMWLGRQSAERERVSEIDWNVFENQLPSLC
ncbi:hypothetical protein [Peribacillus frigoritolerans]|uniref:hypothetical protein n=1 Tax=Peribacillus frigoritolerans TaxID=450367 RepID=UPI002EA242C2|nr:hypothetical protein [Peribacillus frigoritolerans]